MVNLRGFTVIEKASSYVTMLYGNGTILGFAIFFIIILVCNVFIPKAFFRSNHGSRCVPKGVVLTRDIHGVVTFIVIYLQGKANVLLHNTVFVLHFKG